VPLLDTKQLDRLAGGRKQETYWPVAVAQEKFYCIILKGGDRHPYFPRPLLNEFDFQVPLHCGSSAGTGADANATSMEGKKLEETYVRASILHSLQDDLVAATHATSVQKAELGQKDLEIDKILLQLLAAECVDGEDRGMKCMEIVGLLRDRTGRMMEAAGKIAGRFEREVLREKIREVAERRLTGLEEGDAE